VIRCKNKLQLYTKSDDH